MHIGVYLRYGIVKGCLYIRYVDGIYALGVCVCVCSAKARSRPFGRICPYQLYMKRTPTKVNAHINK